jgi:hypothetical protein|tara:strand:- start:85 stop:495 length:411 start_codon:yes stop_codon:yes gene_type:complete
MKKIFTLIILFILPFSQTALVHANDCGPFQTQLSDGQCVDLNDDSSKGAAAGIVLGLAAVGYGIYKMTSSDDTPAEANLRAQELSNGYGIRLNNINTPLRISTMRSVSYNTFSEAKDGDGNQSNLHLNMLTIDYIW